jgi:hypothetical protein
MAKIDYIIYSDESLSKGKFYSNFYGGALIRSGDREAIEQRLVSKKKELNLEGELKWTKVTENYLNKYMQFIDAYFEFIKTNRIKIRIMFTHNINIPPNYNLNRQNNKYFLLYYQFIKHAFGLIYCNPNSIDTVNIQLLLDDVPDTKEKFNFFKDYIVDLSSTGTFKKYNINISKDNIADVDSKKHTIMQGLDIILGSIQFKLNALDKEKPIGARTRGKRTIAKEKLYKHINAKLREIRPNFNIGITTGFDNNEKNYWEHRYRHWIFKPNGSQLNELYEKK